MSKILRVLCGGKMVNQCELELQKIRGEGPLFDLWARERKLRLVKGTADGAATDLGPQDDSRSEETEG